MAYENEYDESGSGEEESEGAEVEGKVHRGVRLLMCLVDTHIFTLLPSGASIATSTVVYARTYVAPCFVSYQKKKRLKNQRKKKKYP